MAGGRVPRLRCVLARLPGTCVTDAAMSEQMSMFGEGGGGKRKRGRSGGNGGRSGGNGGPPPPSEIPTPLHEEARRRYLNYALSVITSRALPDVRDGLKPVQRRIVYGMFHDHHLTHEAKYQKCAKVVGTIMGQYHPHGDVAIYDALVRMAQDFSLRYPLVDGHGNFGSLDGDGAAAMRYTECRLAALAAELVQELSKRTVDYRPNYDGSQFEPIVIPARLPQLLMNGTTGIAVGMATNIPPHNLDELCDALRDLSLHKDLEVKDLLKHIKGPDFPTGAQILNSKSELREIYETGQGSVRIRGEWKLEDLPRGGKQIVITSIPYAVNKSNLVAKIADVINERKVTALVNVIDESTKDVRIVLEIKRDTDPELVMAYLYKHTPLQTNFAVNLTCLVPTDNPEVGAPRRLDLKTILRHFLDFRFEVVRRRFEFDLKEVQQRLHILEGFEKVYDALDEMIRIIRKSEGKQDAAEADQALQALRGAVRRDPRDEALPAGPAGDPGHREGAEGEARRAEAAQGAARQRPRALVGGARGDRRHPEGLRRQAAHAHRRRRQRGDGVQRGGLHRRRGRHRGPDQGRLDQARPRAQGPLADARARGRRGGLRAGRLAQVEPGPLQQLRHRLRDALQRRAALHRLRRPGAEALQVRRQRAGGGRALARSAAAKAREDAGHLQARLRLALRAFAPHRAVHPRRPALRQAWRGRRAARRGPGARQGSPGGRVEVGAHAGLQGGRDQRAGGPWARRARHQARSGRRGDRLPLHPRQAGGGGAGDHQGPQAGADHLPPGAGEPRRKGTPAGEA